MAAIQEYTWLSLTEAARYFGYKHRESFRQRLRQLRQRGYVVDIGDAPTGYVVGEKKVGEDVVVVRWLNSKTALVRSDAPASFFNPKRGRRADR